MELLCLKSGADTFLRITGDSFELTTVNKASVYPLVDLEKVKKLYDTFQKELGSLHIIKLTITEERIEV
jgi:hypothetical protein